MTVALTVRSNDFAEASYRPKDIKGSARDPSETN